MIDEIIIAFKLQPQQIDSDVDLLAEKHKWLESARRLIFSVIMAKGGRLIGQIHGDEIATLPVDQADTIKELHERLDKELHVPATIGVGEDAQQAIDAMRYAAKNNPYTIKVYEPDMDKGPELSKQPLQVAVGPDDIVKSEKHVPIAEEERQQIAQILQSVNANKQVLESMRQERPEAYAAVVSVIQSLAEMMMKDKQDREEHVAKMIEKINAQLDQHTDKQSEKHAKEIQKEIDRHRIKKEAEDKAKADEHWEARKLRKRSERKLLREKPEMKILFALAKGKI